MTTSRSRRRLAAVLLTLPFSPLVRAQSAAAWPTRPIKLVVPFPPGGNSDSVGRIVAERLAADLNVAVVVDNRPGGTTQLGTELVARAAPDGQTLLLGASTAFTVLPHLRSKLPYDPKRGFEPLGAIAEYVSVGAVRKDLGVSTFAELIKMAKDKPGKLTFGSAGLASLGHIAGESIKRDAGVDMLHVPFKGSADAAAALAAGQVDLLIDGTTVPLAKGGRVVALFTFAEKRHPELPAVPAISETGFKVRLPTGPSWGLFAPRGTPPAITARVAQSLQKAIAESDTRARLQRISAMPDWRPPADLMQALDADMRFFGELLPAIGIKPEE